VTAQQKHLKYISHGIYLQMFLGLGYIIISQVEGNPPAFLVNPVSIGAMLIIFGYNSLIYINKYKKSLAANT